MDLHILDFCGLFDENKENNEINKNNIFFKKDKLVNTVSRKEYDNLKLNYDFLVEENKKLRFSKIEVERKNRKLEEQVYKALVVTMDCKKCRNRII